MTDSSLLQLRLLKSRTCVGRDVAPLSSEAATFLSHERQPEVDFLLSYALILNKFLVKSSLYKSKDTYQYKFGSVKAY